MRRFRLLVILCAITTVGAPAVARDEIIPDLAAYQNMTLARVRPGAKAIFYHDGEVDGCPALTARCQRRAYVVGGDLVLIGPTKGSLVKAAYNDRGGQPTEGWILRSMVEPVRVPHAARSAWLGDWTYDEASIDITAGTRPGHVKASGIATWGAHDPERVKSGGINMGDFDDEATITGDRILFDDSRDGGCRVSMRLIGPYLVVADNGDCGGMNVTFSGFYRR
jgi:hypothetical protein